MRYWLVIYFLCVPALAMTQAKDWRHCNCAKDFAYVVQTVETNYVGYADKIAGKETQLAAYTQDLRVKAETEHTSVACLSLVYQWLSFFEDKHLRLELSHLRHSTIRTIFQTPDSVSVTEKTFRDYLTKKEKTQKKKPLTPEGIWRNEAGDLWLGIRKDDPRGHTFTGFILQADSLYWLPRQVKMRMTVMPNGYSYQVQWTNAAHLATTIHTARLDADMLYISDELHLQRVSSQTPIPPRQKPPTFVPADVHMLDTQTVLLTLRSFDIGYKKAIDSTLNAHHAALSHTPTLIIDIRGNRGGLNICYDKVLPYLYTDPIVIDGYTIRATTQNIQLYSRFSHHPDLPPERRKLAWHQINLMKAHEGHMTPMRPDTMVCIGNTCAFPARVAILTNGYTASSAEFFVLRAQQSTKVKIFGQPTMGAVDYVDKLVDKNVPSGLFGLAYPMTKTSRLVKDPSAPVRIPPDVWLSQPETDWLESVRLYVQTNSW